MIHHDRGVLERALKEIRQRVEALGLRLNQKTQIFPLRQGIRFLRWRYILTDSGKIIRRMDKRSIVRERRKIKKLAAKIGKGELPERKLTESYQSWRAHARTGNTKSIVMQMDRLYNVLLMQTRREIRNHEQDHWARTGERQNAAACAGD